MDTTSTALSRILHVLSEHPKEQEILRKEVSNARQDGGDLSHDELLGLPYLDAICKETLRLFVISLQCVTDGFNSLLYIIVILLCPLHFGRTCLLEVLILAMYILNAIACSTRQDIVLPLSKPIRGVNGKQVNEIAVPGNTVVIIGLMAVNRNPDIWGADVLEWKPERWLSPLPGSVTAAHIPGVYSSL
jgi:hypothetical protein